MRLRLLCCLYLYACLASTEQLGKPAASRPPLAPLPAPKSRSSLLEATDRRQVGRARRASSAAPKLVASAATLAPRRPAFQWAMLHNWLYFLSLGLSVPNLPRVVSSIVNPDGSVGVTPASIKLSGDVEAVDKVLTFLGVGFLCALSDVKGRKALMAWSALGYGLTCLLQGTTKSSVGLLYLADLIDGVSSCMSPVCQAYVTDASPPDRCVINLGIFQGISIGGAFIVAFPLGGVLGSKLGPRVPILLGAAAQLLNFMLIAFVTPESNTKEMRQGKRINLKEANPFVRRPCGINKTPKDSRPAPSLLLLTRLRVVRLGPIS